MRGSEELPQGVVRVAFGDRSHDEGWEANLVDESKQQEGICCPEKSGWGRHDFRAVAHTKLHNWLCRGG